MSRTLIAAVALTALGTLPSLAASQPTPIGQSSVAGMTVSLAMTPTPVKAMTEHRFVVVLQQASKPVQGASVSLDLRMPGMFMGINRPKLTETKAGTYVGTGIFPHCHMGGGAWEAEVRIERQGHHATVFALPGA